MDEVELTGRDAMMMMSRLLQRVRLADPRAGLWEAADVQWWSRRPRASDEVGQSFWMDDDNPVGAVYLTAWNDTWQCDPVVLPGSGLLPLVWERALERAPAELEVPVPGPDDELRSLVEASGLVPGEGSSTSWLSAPDGPRVRALSEGFVLVPRTERLDRPHPMIARSGDTVAERLAATPLYDPTLDLSVESADGQVAGYALFWADPVTGVGLVEPVRVEDAFQRRGIASALVSAGVERLISRGMTRVKIGYESEAARAVYEGVGFRTTSFDVWWKRAH
jgi:GNAT superfamily N-acetyltransferase